MQPIQLILTLILTITDLMILPGSARTGKTE